jgi:hypothetical protein
MTHTKGDVMKKLALVTIALTLLAAALGQFVPNGKLAGVAKAEAEYAAVAARLAGFVHPGIGKIVLVQDEANCTGFGWKGKIMTVAHCEPGMSFEKRKQITSADPAISLEMDQVDHQLEIDLYTVGIECSMDLRWWGATTGEWRSLKWEDLEKVEVNQANKFAKNELVRMADAIENAKIVWPAYGESTLHAEGFIEEAENAAAAWALQALGNELCFEGEFGADPSSVGHFRPGDSGGPLMAGDEPIGVVSNGNNTTMWNCFSAIEPVGINEARVIYRDQTIRQWIGQVNSLRRNIEDVKSYHSNN